MLKAIHESLGQGTPCVAQINAVVVDMHKQIVRAASAHRFRTLIAGNPLCALVPVGYPLVHVYEIDAILEAIEDTSEKTFPFAHNPTLKMLMIARTVRDKIEQARKVPFFHWRGEM
jgi:hypothetical protein